MINSIPIINLLCLLISFSILWTCHSAALCIGDKLRPGEALNSSSFMVSNSGEFTLGFNSGYLTLRSKDYTVWVANLHTPISDPSTALLTLDKTVLQITHKDENLIVLYSSSDNSTDVVATLTDSGILVLQEVDQNVVLWQSFDNPTVALMPEMKVGVDNKNLKGWVLWSWLESQNSPGLGSFTLHWFGDSRELEVWRDGDLWWTSGELRNGEFEFINIPYEFKQVRYSFSMVSNENENSFSYNYSAFDDQNVRSVWVLHTDGELYDVNYNISIARAGDCDGYNTDGGCRRWRGRDTGYCPLGSFANDFELIKNGSFKPISMDMSINSTWLDTNQSRYGSGRHCKAACWMDCDCLGFNFLYDNQTGCRFWSVKISQLLEDPDSSATKYIILQG